MQTSTARKEISPQNNDVCALLPLCSTGDHFENPSARTDTFVLSTCYSPDLHPCDFICVLTISIKDYYDTLQEVQYESDRHMNTGI